ncbi:hypothetical protein ACHQM5_019563 [Ranunculus cassubicifolius]
MTLQWKGFLVYHSLLLCICAVLFTNAQDIAKSGCQSKCGDISIPYPFGIGNGCYREKGFEVICTYPNRTFNFTRDVSNSPSLILNVPRTPILELSLEQVRIGAPSISSCYVNKSGERQRRHTMFDLTQTPFTFSYTRNKFAAVGCDIFSYIFDPNNSKYITGCASLCDRNGLNMDLKNASCSGIGCCRASIPRGLKFFNLSVDSINSETHPLASESSGCRWAALNDAGNKFPMKLYRYQGNISFTGLYSTATLDWAIDSVSCQDIRKNKLNSACIATNSICINSTNGPGYRCNCSRGYQGNPYLPSGCQDIDECKGPNECDKGTTCKNLEGSYTCTCPNGYSGDGRKRGSGLSCSPPALPTNGRSKKVEVILVGTGIALGLLLIFALSYWLHVELRDKRKKKLKEKFFKKNGGLLLEQQLSSDEGNVERTKIFVTEELEKATDNFNESRVLGRGGSGTVYKGMLTDGRIVAVKKSKIVDESQTGQFINELVILSQINHKHVVKLMGCCLEAEVPLLVYEYISNGTLFQHLHDDILKSSLTWEQRLRISIEIAGALSYLHSSASTPIFHRDIKSSNILLNEAYKAIVSDFGISRSVPYEKTHLTTLVQGTFGYLDPEYFHSGQFTEKSDVYSFGIVLVELLTGQKPISVFRTEQEKNLAMHFISSVKEGRLFHILDTLELNETGKKCWTGGSVRVAARVEGLMRR